MFETLFPLFVCILVTGKHSEGGRKNKTLPLGFKVQTI